MRNSIGLGLGFDDWDLGLWKGLWKSGKMVGICWWERVWESGCFIKRKEVGGVE